MRMPRSGHCLVGLTRGKSTTCRDDTLSLECCFRAHSPQFLRQWDGRRDDRISVVMPMRRAHRLEAWMRATGSWRATKNDDRTTKKARSGPTICRVSATPQTAENNRHNMMLLGRHRRVTTYAREPAHACRNGNCPFPARRFGAIHSHPSRSASAPIASH